ncbi:MAG: hypothetical protein GXO92_00465, partial [FCB group bacterium]|nr:hypothetical protein [FCB group bacterium]
MKILSVLLIIAGMMMVGCEDEVTDLSNTEAELMQLLNEDEALAFDGLNDGGAVDLEYEEGLETGGAAKTMIDTLWPNHDDYRIRFGRRITNVETLVDFDIDEDNGVAVADVNRTVTGKFIVVAFDTAYAVVDSFVKPFESVFSRKVRFIKVDDSERHWRVDAFTIGAGGAGSKVAITQIQIFARNDSIADYTFTADQVGDMFITRDSIPTFNAWRPVRVEVTVENAGPEFPYLSGEGVMLHYGRNRRYKARKMMHDNGAWGDATANDNVFTRVWRIHGPG